MRSIIVLLCCLFPMLSFALGDLCHNYVADQVKQQLAAEHPDVNDILTRYHNEYLIGSDYPDTGFVPGHDFGEIAHWPSFVDPFIDYIRTTYAHPKNDAERAHRDRLTAFLLGISTHDKSDIVSHWNFYQWVAKYDFHGVGREARIGGKVYAKAHKLMDPGSDAYVTVRKGIYNHPKDWWIPVKDLVAVYKNIKRPDINADLIINTNAEYYLITGLDEDIIAYPEYWYNALIAAPWAMKNFENTDPKYGALPEMIHQAADYALDVWQRVQAQTPMASNMAAWPQVSQKDEFDVVRENLMPVVDHAIHVGWLTIDPTTDQFGDVMFTPKSIHFNSTLAKAQFEAALKEAVQKIIKQLEHKS